VTAGTSRLSKEERLPAFGVAGQADHFFRSLQSPQVSDDGLDVSIGERMKAGHAGPGDAMLNDPEDLNVRESLHMSRRNTWRSVAASAIETVASRAACGKEFFAFAR
jgi:hypothetical protein